MIGTGRDAVLSGSVGLLFGGSTGVGATEPTALAKRWKKHLSGSSPMKKKRKCRACQFGDGSIPCKKHARSSR